MLFSNLFKKVMAALRLGLPVDKKTLAAVEHLFKRRDRSARIAARAMVATLLYTSKDPKGFKRDLGVVELIFSQWMRRIAEGHEPFYKDREKAKLVEVLKRNNFPNPEKFVNHLIVEFSYDVGENFNSVLKDISKSIEREVKEVEKKKMAVKKTKEEEVKHGKAKVHT